MNTMVEIVLMAREIVAPLLVPVAQALFYVTGIAIVAVSGAASLWFTWRCAAAVAVSVRSEFRAEPYLSAFLLVVGVFGMSVLVMLAARPLGIIVH